MEIKISKDAEKYGKLIEEVTSKRQEMVDFGNSIEESNLSDEDMARLKIKGDKLGKLATGQ